MGLVRCSAQEYQAAYQQVEWTGGTTGAPWHEWELNALPVFTRRTIAVDSFGELSVHQRSAAQGAAPAAVRPRL